jgi:hypothetical protein
MNTGDRVRVKESFPAPAQYHGALATVVKADFEIDRSRSVQTPWIVVDYDSNLLGLFGRGIILETDLELL